MNEIIFKKFPSIARLSREMWITEKIDGTNGVIYNGPLGEFMIGSRARWITPDNDNHGFAAWAYSVKEELKILGPGYHRGEWWGNKINRGYGLEEGDKRFSLFNQKFNGIKLPDKCNTVPVLYMGIFRTDVIENIIEKLKMFGSIAVPGYDNPEGIVIYHVESNVMFKKTIKDDEFGKGFFIDHVKTDAKFKRIAEFSKYEKEEENEEEEEYE